MSDKIQTRYEMVRAGYKFKSTAACKGCGASIEWWQTTNNKMMPFNPIESDQSNTVPHWATCPNRANFKSANDRKNDARIAREKGAQSLLAATNARAVIVLYDDGVTTLSWRNGLAGEDLKHEAVTAANKLRHAVMVSGGN